MLKLLLCLLALAGAAGTWATQATAADAPPCRPDAEAEEFTAELAFNHMPERAVIGLPTHATVYIGHADESGDPDRGTHVAFGPAGETAISHPYFTSYPSAKRSGAETFQQIPVHFGPGDGPAVITVSMVRDGYAADGKYGRCRRTVTSPPITPIEPAVSFAKGERPRVGKWEPDDDEDLSRSVDFEFKTDLCGAERLELTFRISGAKSPYRLTGEPGCQWKTRTRRGPQGLLVWTEEDYGVSVTLDLKTKRTVMKRVSYTVAFSGRQLKTGSFELQMHYKPGRPGYRIYETSPDRYWNVCIREDYEIYSSGGRLYCYVSGIPARRYATVHKLK